MADRSPLSSELVSGPDLGAGFLHQLSIDRLGESTTFTHHAQTGGQDAGGPPRGPLDPLGFVHPESPCMFGGPRCWHRRYLLPFADLPKVRFAYQRFRLVLATMIAQAYGDAEVPVGAALRDLIGRLGAPFAERRIPWYVGGSTAGWLLGGALQPKDIDLGTDREGVDRAAALLAEYLIEPLAPTDWGPGRLVRGARAFLGAPAEGARVEWSVPLEPGRSMPAGEFGGDPARVRTIDVPFAGTVVRASRPEYGLVRSAERGREESVAAWGALVRRLGPDLPLLDALLEVSQLAPAARSSLRATIVR